MAKPIQFKVEIAGVEQPIAWGNRAMYRLGTLPAPPTFSDLRDPRKNVSAFVGLLWCALQDSAAYASPEALAEALPLDDAEAMAALLAEFAKAIAHHTDQKKSSGSKA